MRPSNQLVALVTVVSDAAGVSELVTLLPAVENIPRVTTAPCYKDVMTSITNLFQSIVAQNVF